MLSSSTTWSSSSAAPCVKKSRRRMNFVGSISAFQVLVSAARVEGSAAVADSPPHADLQFDVDSRDCIAEVVDLERELHQVDLEAGIARPGISGVSATPPPPRPQRDRRRGRAPPLLPIDEAEREIIASPRWGPHRGQPTTWITRPGASSSSRGGTGRSTSGLDTDVLPRITHRERNDGASGAGPRASTYGRKFMQEEEQEQDRDALIRQDANRSSTVVPGNQEVQVQRAAIRRAAGLRGHTIRGAQEVEPPVVQFQPVIERPFESCTLCLCSKEDCEEEGQSTEPTRASPLYACGHAGLCPECVKDESAWLVKPMRRCPTCRAPPTLLWSLIQKSDQKVDLNSYGSDDLKDHEIRLRHQEEQQQSRTIGPPRQEPPRTAIGAEGVVLERNTSRGSGHDEPSSSTSRSRGGGFLQRTSTLGPSTGGYRTEISPESDSGSPPDLERGDEAAIVHDNQRPHTATANMIVALDDVVENDDLHAEYQLPAEEDLQQSEAQGPPKKQEDLAVLQLARDLARKLCLKMDPQAAQEATGRLSVDLSVFFQYWHTVVGGYNYITSRRLQRLPTQVEVALVRRYSVGTILICRTVFCGPSMLRPFYDQSAAAQSTTQLFSKNKFSETRNKAKK
ncbi:unnamed protein product [Amoebophrya sp. A25]|nr:unnamed protein product [Amoebophrya sp. A25]|eukprot:GSA25T00027113001.1